MDNNDILSINMYDGFSAKDRRRVKVLLRRAKHLEERINTNQQNMDLSYDKAELSALRWVLTLIYEIA